MSRDLVEGEEAYVARRRPRLAQGVIDALETRIRTQSLLPGDKLPTEQQLEAEFAVSRTVVREAIAHLRASGLVASRQGKGMYVCAPTEAAFGMSAADLQGLTETLELLELRLGIEVEAAGIAAVRRSAPQEAAMREAFSWMGDLISRGESAAEADFAFHRCIMEATNNRFYADVFSFLGKRTIPRSRLQNGPEADVAAYLERVQAEHLSILTAIGEQDADEARRQMRLHLAGSQKRYRRLLSPETLSVP